MNCENRNCKWGGKRQDAGRKKTCLKKVPFNRRINENILNILKSYAFRHGLTDTEALESAILMQTNNEILQGGFNMKIAIPSADGKLCGHFGHCEDFTFVEVNPDTKEILSVETKVPEEGISCQSAGWISEQGVNIVLAGGMGGRPMAMFAQNGVEVISGCPELEIRELVTSFLNSSLAAGENTCVEGGHCHGHEHGGHCGHNH